MANRNPKPHLADLNRSRAEDPLVRFWRKVNKTEGGCWLWTGSVDKSGYGQHWVNPKNVRAHRFAYEQLVGPIPEGAVIDHVKERGCFHRHCVNPAHLEPVTQKVNSQRGDTGKRHLIAEARVARILELCDLAEGMDQPVIRLGVLRVACGVSPICGQKEAE